MFEVNEFGYGARYDIELVMIRLTDIVPSVTVKANRLVMNPHSMFKLKANFSINGIVSLKLTFNTVIRVL